MIRILVVSDRPVVRAGLERIIEASDDCQVVGGATLDEVISQVAGLRPDVVLVDILDDGLDSAEPFWQLATEMPGLDIIVMSHDADEIQARHALESGARGYLLWDVSGEEIVAAVRAVHQGLTVLHPAIAQVLLGRPSGQGLQTRGEALTTRELEVLRLLAQGLPSKTIASRLRISEHTIKFHVGSILGKLGAASRTEAVTIAIRRGLVTL